MKRPLPLSHRRADCRAGVAAVECAFCIPIVILLMFGTLETCSGIFLKESLTVAAFEGARVGVRRGATPQLVQEQVQAILELRQVVDAEVLVEPADFSGLSALDPITVVVRAPTRGNSLYIFDFLVDREVSAEVSMVREFDN